MAEKCKEACPFYVMCKSVAEHRPKLPTDTEPGGRADPLPLTPEDAAKKEAGEAYSGYHPREHAIKIASRALIYADIGCAAEAPGDPQKCVILAALTQEKTIGSSCEEPHRY